MLSSLEALDDPPKPTPVVRASVFQPKAKPRARKASNNVSNSSDKTKANVVETPPEQPAKVPKCETGTILEEVPVSVPVSRPQTPGEPPVSPSSTAVDNPVDETSVLEFPSIQEPVVTEVTPLSLPAYGENPQLEELVPLHTTGSLEHATQDNGESYSAHDVTDVSPAPCLAIQEAPSVAEDEKPQIELRRSKRKAVINRHFGITAEEFGEVDEEIKVSHLSKKRNKERDQQQSQYSACEPKTKFENKDEVRKVARDCKGTQQKILEGRENVSITNAEKSPEVGVDLANNLAMKKHNQSRSRRPKMSLRKLGHDSTAMQQGILESTGNASISNTGNPPEERVAPGDPEETNNQSRCQRDKMRVRKCTHDSTIIQQDILENRGNVYVSNTENLLVEGLVPASNIDDNSNKTSKHHSEKMKMMKAAHDPVIMEAENLESGENVPVPNTETVLAEGLGPANDIDNKSNNQSRHRGQKMKVSRAANDSTLKEQDVLGCRENISVPTTEILPEKRLAPTNDSDNKNINQWRRRKLKVKARKSTNDSTMLQQDVFENRDDVSVPSTGNPPGKGVAPLNLVDNKNNNQSGHRKQKSKSSTENVGRDDSSTGIHGTDLQPRGNLEIAITDKGQPLEDPEINKNVAAKQKKKKKHASKSGELSLEGSKKKFSHSTRRHKRRVEKHLLDTPEADLDHSKLTMRDIIWLAEAKERKLNKEATAKKKSRVSETTPNSTSKETHKAIEEDEGISLAPQVQVVNGQIVINEQSLLVSARELNTDDIRTYRRVEESSSKLNYHSYMNRTPVERWSKSDTELFYKAMRQFGADFTMIQHLFPGRTRSQVKAKYKREERYHPLQLADTLIYRPQDHSHYQKLIDHLKISPEAAEHDHVQGGHAEPASLEDLLTERLDEDHEGRGVNIHRINSSLDSPPKTPESDTSEQMYANEKDSVNNCEGLPQRDERNMGATTLVDQNMKDSDVDEQAFLDQENGSNDKPSAKPAKSLFSYQTAPPKPVISLFSYQQA